MAGLYLHIPFCRHTCVYCDFHFVTTWHHKGALVEAIAAEIPLRAGFLPKEEPLQSLYLGGGTPSVLTIEELSTILEAVHQHHHFRPDAEQTLEANPEDLSPEVLAAWRKMGINRLSLGIQSFAEADLRWMNRHHSPEQVVEGVAMAREAGFKALTGDLIFGLPNRKLTDWDDNISQLLSLELPHVSVYSLTQEPRTVFDHQVRTGKVQLPDDEAAASQFLHAHTRLTEAGYVHYELSNYAKPGWEAVHNSNYWTGAPYLGIGPSAHGFDGQQRYWNHAHNQRYRQAVLTNQLPEADREILSATDQYHEYMMTHLRHRRGINLDYVEQNWVPNWRDHFRDTIAQGMEEGWMILEGATLTLSPEGWLVSDQLISDFFLG